MANARLNKTQVSILYSLRHTESMRYSDLMHPTGLESDSFKFHLRSLVELGLIKKRDDGRYNLTAKGKEFANNLDDKEGITQKQPKLTLRICLARHNNEGETEYLFQERHRNPYWGYWDIIGGPVLWGEAIEETATRELKKQTGLDAAFSVKAFYRVRDFDEGTDLLLEDKLFAILAADTYKGELTNTWQGGHNSWMTINELLKTGRYFVSIPKMISHAEHGPAYGAEEVKYDPSQY